MPAFAHLKQHLGFVSLAAFFGLKVLLALVLLKLSAAGLDAHGFALFSQFLLFSALLNLVGSGGVQNGLVRQIASAAGDPAASRTAFRAALEIWVAVSCLAIPAILLRDEVSVLLIGNGEGAWIVPWIVVAAVLNGLGQLFNAVLIGSCRLAANAGSQAAGLTLGTAIAVFFLMRGEAGQAVIGFAVGSLATTVCSGLLSRNSAALTRGAAGNLVAERRWLVAYSGAFVFAASLTPIVLFGLRYFYRDSFGVDAVGDWLVANRVSDVSTQLLGLFMAQWFLPQLARTPEGPGAMVLARQAFGIGTVVMLSFVAIFAIGAGIWVPMLLSAQYIAASGFIAAYMLGDALRVSASIALHGALARRRLWTYVGVEMVSAGLLAVITGVFIYAGWRSAPVVGYLSTFGLIAVVCLGFHLRALLETRRTAEAT